MHIQSRRRIMEITNLFNSVFLSELNIWEKKNHLMGNYGVKP